MAAYKTTRVPSYVVLLLFLAFVFVSFVGYQKMRDVRLANDLISQKEAQIQSLQRELQIEKETSDLLHGKFEELQRRSDILRTEKVTLNMKLTETEIAKNSIEEERKQLQSFLQGKEDEINQLKEWQRKATEKNGEVKILTGILDKKENEIKEVKARLAEFEEGAGKSQNKIEEMEIHKPDDAGKTQLVNTTENTSAEQNYTTEVTKDNDSLQKGNMEDDYLEGRTMENVEKDALEAKVGTTVDDGRSHERLLDESSKLQDSRTQDEEEDERDNIEDQDDTEGNDNSDDLKDLEDLDVTTDDKDLEDVQGEGTDRATDEEETDI